MQGSVHVGDHFINDIGFHKLCERLLECGMTIFGDMLLTLHERRESQVSDHWALFNFSTAY